MFQFDSKYTHPYSTSVNLRKYLTLHGLSFSVIIDILAIVPVHVGNVVTDTLISSAWLDISGDTGAFQTLESNGQRSGTWQTLIKFYNQKN